MAKQYTLEEIRAKYRTPDFSKMSTADKAAHLAKSLDRSRQRLEEQSRMMAELRRRMEPNATLRPKLGLRTWDEVKAYVDRIARGPDECQIDGSVDRDSG